MARRRKDRSVSYVARPTFIRHHRQGRAVTHMAIDPRGMARTLTERYKAGFLRVLKGSRSTVTFNQGASFHVRPSTEPPHGSLLPVKTGR